MPANSNKVRKTPLNRVLANGYQSAGTEGVTRGVVVGHTPTGEILVVAENEPDRRIVCERLETADALRAPYRPGDRVLVLLPASDEELGCVLGRVGLPQPGEIADADGPTETVVRARGRLTLLCGEASITLSEDGKILIKGVDVVSRATVSNRIKGGSVRIN